MQLTTPEAKEYDTVFPGENWFFFWRTSPSLWESKLAEYQGPQPIFVPLFWGLHNENPDQVDFGSYRPETDLHKLHQAALNTGKEIAFALPLTPAPFLPNGGLPSFLARTPALDQDGLAMACVDNDGRLNKMHSFFDPRVFQAFRSFCSRLGRFLSERAVAREVFGLDCHFLMEGDQGGSRSFFDDSSKAFEQGFARYINQIKAESEDFQIDPKNREELKRLKEDYSSQIKSLYTQAVEETLAANWSGQIQVGFLGAAPADILGRTSDSWERPEDYFGPLFKSLTLDVLPCSALLAPNAKKAPLTKALASVVTESNIKEKLNNDLYEDDYSSSFHPVYHFELIGKEGDDTFKNAGLITFLNREYPWSYKIHAKLEDQSEEEEVVRTRFFSGKTMDQKHFSKMIRLLMNGSSSFLDVCGLSPEIKQRLDLFVVENDLKVEKLNYVCPISRINLGEGSIVTIDSDKLAEAGHVKKLNFWETMISYLKIKRLKIESDEGVFFFWTARASNAYELNYEEIRRANLFNATSYKKKARIVSAKNFAFVKTIDQKNAEVRSTPIGIEILLLPGGSVSLDFGFYE